MIHRMIRSILWLSFSRNVAFLCVAGGVVIGGGKTRELGKNEKVRGKRKFIKTAAPSAAPASAGQWRLTETVGTGEVAQGFGSDVAYLDNLLVVGLAQSGVPEQGSIESFSRGSVEDSFELVDTTTEERGRKYGFALDVISDFMNNTKTLIVGSPRSRDIEFFGVSFGLAFVYISTGTRNDQQDLWELTGVLQSDMLLEESGGLFGFDVSLAAATATTPVRAAVGAASSSTGISALDTGRVYTFEFNGVTWERITEPFSGQPGSFLGSSLALNSDGTTLVIGGPGDGGGRGGVFVHVLTEGNPVSWEVEAAFPGSSPLEEFGNAVAWISDSIFVAGGPGFETNAGVIRAYLRTEIGFFLQLGTDITGNPNEMIGTSLCGSDYGRFGFGTATGLVRLYEFDATMGDWALTEEFNTPSKAGVLSCSFSNDGTTIVAGLESELVAVWDFS